MGWIYPPGNTFSVTNHDAVWGQEQQDVEEVEVYTLEWPGDDLLCDKYEGSEGPLIYTVSRLRSSKKIIHVSADGAYCQGDSEFFYTYFFDEKGNAIYSISLGMYSPNVFSLYQDGKCVTKVETRGEGEENYAPRVKKVTSEEIVTSSDFEKAIEEHFQDMKKRIEALEMMTFRPDEPHSKVEADSIRKLLEAEVKKGITYQPGFVWRKPIPGEKALIIATDVRVRSAWGSSAGVISKISCYDNNPLVIAVGDEETIVPYGTHAWYKIRFTDGKTQKSAEGWIFGAFVAKNIFPETR